MGTTTMIRRPMLVSLAVFALIAAACTSGQGGGAGTSASTAPPTATSPTATTSPTPGTIVLPVSTVHFADLAIVPMVDQAQAPPYPGPATPHSLKGVAVAEPVQDALNAPGVSPALTNDGFVIVPADLKQFHFAYQDNVYGGWPVFVTTDAAYHVWHLVFDKLLRSLEQEVLLPRLETLVAGLLNGAHAQTVDLAGSPMADDASRVEQLYQVAAAELGMPGALGPLAQQDKALIDAHNTEQRSPITGAKIDYTLFTPRGHYTRNQDLTRYFLTMSVLGQLAFCLPGTVDCRGLDSTRQAIRRGRNEDDLISLKGSQIPSKRCPPQIPVTRTTS